MRGSALIVVLLAGCASPRSPGGGVGGGGGAAEDLSVASDGGSPTDLLTVKNDLGGAVDLKGGSDLAAIADLSSPADLTVVGTIGPGVGLPNPGGLVCTTPGSLFECPLTQVCRFFTPAEGRCESCTNCGNLWASCTQSSDCDILFVCYFGRCENFCTLGTSECGAVNDCVNVGHATRGVCRN